MPRLSESAVEEIQNFFVALRGQYSEKDRSLPISVRQLESLIRMAEASARIRLSDVAEAEDARRAIRLLFSYLAEVAFDPETGKLDVDRATGGMPAKKREEFNTLINIIRQLEEREGAAVKLDDVLRDAEAQGMDVIEVEKALDQLLKDGTLFEPKRGFIQRL